MSFSIKKIVSTLLGAVILFSIVYSVSSKIIENKKPKVVIVEIKGELRDPIPELKKLQTLYENDSVKAVVIRVDSPGGAVGTAQEIYRAIERLKEKKPVVVSMGNIAASGGLYLSMPANVIYANSGTIVGSIGVIIQHKNFKELLDKIGVEFENVKSGKNKDLLNIAQPLTKEKKKILQQTVMEVYDQFLDAILKYRPIDEKTLRSIADGRVFSAETGIKYHLVDKIGNLQDAIDEAKKLSGYENPMVVKVEVEKPILKQLLGSSFKNVFGSFSSIDFLSVQPIVKFELE